MPPKLPAFGDIYYYPFPPLYDMTKRRPCVVVSGIRVVRGVSIVVLVSITESEPDDRVSPVLRASDYPRVLTKDSNVLVQAPITVPISRLRGKKGTLTDTDAAAVRLALRLLASR